jgi:hypothetical protein
MIGTLNKNDIGVALRLTITEYGTPINLSAATVKKIKFRAPGAASTIEKAATFTTDGSDGQVQCLTGAGDLDTIGTWKIQGYIELGTYKGHTTFGTFKVIDTL